MRRARTKKHAPRQIKPVVDEADVDFFVGILKQSTAELTAEDRADTVARIAAQYAGAKGFSREWGQELARRVRQRAVWTKPGQSE